MDRPQYDKYMAANDGYVVGPTPYWEKLIVWPLTHSQVLWNALSGDTKWTHLPASAIGRCANY